MTTLPRGTTWNDVVMNLIDVWPLFALELRTPRLVLRPTRDDDFAALVEAAVAGVHDPEVMPFSQPWTDQDPETLARELARWHWSLRVNTRPEKWTIPFTVLVDGEIVGVQDLGGTQFPLLRVVNSGSWLTQRVQGRGFGTEMRQALLMFAFDHLDAEEATSEAAEWNERSLGVSRALGYVDDGIMRAQGRPGQRETMQRVRVTRDAFIRPDWTLETTGVAPARAFLGL